MIADNTISKAIDVFLEQKDQEKKASHKRSGKLSASKLGWPLQHQILDSMGIEGVPFDSYTLRKFLRGVQVEDWLVGLIPGVIEKQKFVEYRNVVGYIDALVDMTTHNANISGVIPHEIKSVTNADFKNIAKAKGAKDQHLLQAALYAMALNTKYFAIDYVAADDLRVLTWIYEVSPFKNRIDSIIDTFNKQKATGKIPVFKPLYTWQANKKYNSWSDWMDLTEEEIQKKFDRRATAG